MSLLDEWAEAEDAAAAARGAGGILSGAGWAPQVAAADGVGLDPLLLEADDVGADGAPVAPLFAIETLEKDASHGQGAITAVAAAANVVLLGTASGALIRYDFAEGAATGSPASARLCS